MNNLPFDKMMMMMFIFITLYLILKTIGWIQ
jgi:hypothetical protein